MTILYIDFESRSPVDLKKAGLDNYAKHRDTEVLCLGWAFDDELPRTMAPYDDKGWHSDELARIICHLSRGATIVAHNASFELAIWNNICVPRFGWPRLKPEQVHCTMAMAYAMSLPGSLDNAAAAVGLEIEKDKAGHRLMLAMCKPKADGSYRESSEDMKRLMAYCATDVEVERQLYKRLRPLSPSEHSLWVLDQKINQRGIYVDKESIKAAIEIVGKEQKRLDSEMRALTGGAVATCTAIAQLVDWIRWQGVPIPGVAKADVLDALAGDLPAPVRTALLLRREAGKSSTAKLKAMVESASADSRIRGAFQYHGAATGRWAGRRVQFQNLPRPELKPTQVEDALRLMREGKRDEVELVYGPVLGTISSCIRGVVSAPPGKELIACDFANIESRVLAWLAGAEWKLQAFRDCDKGIGPDIYLVACSWVYGTKDIAVLKPHRQEGKVVELGFGFGGSAGAAFTMAKTYFVDLDKLAPRVLEVAENEFIAKAESAFANVAVEYSDRKSAYLAGHILSQIYRAKNPEIKKYWFDCDNAAINAVRYPGDVFEAGHRPVKFRVSGSFLWCQLPSGRLLCYPYPKIVENRFGKATVQCMWQNGTTNKWESREMWYGLWVENFVQAVARDLLAFGMQTLDEAGFDVVAHAHDECVVEISTSMPETTLHEVETRMIQVPAWAEGLPMAAEGWRGRRYRK